MWTTLALMVLAAGVVHALTEAEIADLLEQYNLLAVRHCTSSNLAAWNVDTNRHDPGRYEEIQANVEREYAEFLKREQPAFADIDLRSIQNETLRRQVAVVQQLGTMALDEDALDEFSSAVNRMTLTYDRARICPFEEQSCSLDGDQGLKLDPDLHDIMDASQDYDKLKYVWEQWHEKSGKPMRADFGKYVELLNSAAKANGKPDAAKLWQSAYENVDFDGLDNLWAEVRPLYEELHKYVSNKLSGVYEERLDAFKPYLPAHVLGNMWAQSWSGLYESTKPFDIDDNLGDVTRTMHANGYDVPKMFEVADDFFVRLGLPSNNMSFGEKAFMVAPTDGRQIACHASAWDFCDGEDFRIKMCTSVNLRDFITIHHEMGHIAYYQAYAGQPLQLRAGANPAFHEAIGDAIALSFSNPKHLTKIGLIPANTKPEEDHQREINALYHMALERIAFLPFGLLMDKWRWEVFNGTTSPEKWNERFWELRKQYQLIVPPSARSEEFFDAGGKFHVPADTQYIGYFYAGLLQFQLYRSFCIEAKQFNPNDANGAPLHNCDYFGSLAVGEKLQAGLRLGSSRSWADALEVMTGERTINGAAIKEYFRPLHEHLVAVNRQTELPKLKAQLETYSQAKIQFCTALNNADWDVTTDLKNAAKAAALERQRQLSALFEKSQYNDYFKGLNPNDYTDESVSRQLKFLTKLGTNILEPSRLTELNQRKSAMVLVYNTAKVCPYSKQDCDLKTEGLELDPDIGRVMSESSDFDEMRHVWSKWHDNTGSHMRENYREYLKISNEAAVLNEFKDNGEMWRYDYEDDNFQENLLKLWSQVEPLYDAMHTYVRHQLIDLYGDKIDRNDKLIPAHLLGNMWAQSWVNIYERIKPFKNASAIDVTASMKDKFKVLDMFKESDRFYKDLGLEPNEMSYTGKSIIEKPTDREIVCHASAWDFCDGKDFRIKQCTQVQQTDFVTIHHEMGHIQYFIQYAKQPMPFRDAANPGFHEAIGDVIAMSVSTPKHLQKIGLLHDYNDGEEESINALLKMALERVAFLPFGLLIDMYRWELFAGKVPENRWNARWQELRERFQKLRAPVPRSEANFDAGAKFHVASDYQYINYFVAHILEFQLHEALCREAGQLDNGAPLHKCDIDGSRAAGAKIAIGLKAGKSRHWSDTLEAMSGDRVLKAESLLKYFAPLKQYLERVNAEWERQSKQDIVRKQIETRNEAALKICTASSNANWEVTTDLGNADKKTALEKQIQISAAFHKEQYNNYFKDLNPNEFDDPLVSRQLKFLTKLGTSVLEPARLTELNNRKTALTLIYNKAKVCPFKTPNCDVSKDGLELNPDLERLMSESSDFDELRHVWSEWHDNTGSHMRDNYREYLKISNEAAVLNGFKDNGEMWRFDYEDDKFQENMLKLWAQVEPLYDSIHTYVRHQLASIYGEKIDPTDKLIPAHLLGNMWGQTWVNIFERVKPFKNASEIDVDDALKAKYSVLGMFQESDRFYKDLGLEPNEMSYTGKSIIEKPTDREIVCHASAWDFCDGKDFRIKQCTQRSLEDLVTIHHEMGHIQYYIQYAKQPLPLRGGANPGFHEAIGDLIAMSMSTPNHLQKIGLLSGYKDTEEDNINALLKMAFERVAFLPFGLLIDMYRWELFAGKVPENKWNARWEELREQFQKVRSPVRRSEANFDAGAKFHVASDYQYMNYFVAHILEFQLHEAMCREAGQLANGAPLHKCDIDGSRAAGAKIAAGLKMGKSQHWSQALEVMTGDRELKADALLKYFAPLKQYLDGVNGKWEQDREQEQRQLRVLLAAHSKEEANFCSSLKNAEWDMNTDMKNDTKASIVETQIKLSAEFAKQQYNKHFKGLNPAHYSDVSVSRQIKFLTKLGTNVLTPERLHDLHVTNTGMVSIFNAVRVCPFKKPKCNPRTDEVLDLAAIERLMGESKDAEELKYYWAQWHDKSGSPIRPFYKKYVEISNEAATANGFRDNSEMWQFAYEDPDFETNMLQLWAAVEPLYDAMHTYVRHKLLEEYGKEMNATDPLIPAHLLGHMYAQTWSNLFERIKPFKNASSIDVSDALKKKFTVLNMFEESDRFFQNLGLKSNAMSYTGPKPIIEKPTDREIVCHASAWDFCDGQDFRIRQCTEQTQKHLLTVHHEMGHIQYYIQYADQPVTFRQGANPGFHEAIGDLMALSVSTPQHLQKIGLLSGYKDTEEDNINALLKMALERVAFLPSGLLIDLYRWELFAGKVPEARWNARWEELREKYQKIRSPVPRTEANFDAGAKFHVPADVQYALYFVAYILEFQLHKAMCREAGQLANGAPLHKCDIDGSRAAGAKLAAGMAAGRSVHWSDTLFAMTGERQLRADALLEYFAPLRTFLDRENAAWKPPGGHHHHESENLPLVPIIVGSMLVGGLIVGVLVALSYFLCVRKRLTNAATASSPNKLV